MFIAAPVRHLLFLLTLACLLAGVRPVQSAELDKIIAVVDEDVIMQSEFDQQLSKIREQIRRQGAEPPSSSILEKQVLERLILQKIQVQIAARTGITVSEESLDKAIADIAKRNNLSDAKFRDILASEGYDFKVFREDIRQEIMLSRLRKEEVDKRIQVSDREIDNYVSNARSGSDQSEQELKVSHILVSLPSGATERERAEARKKVEAALARIKGGEEFRQVAIATSDAQDALDGGDLGWRKLSELPSLIADVARDFQEGQTSEVVTSPSGFHIIKLTGRRNAAVTLVEQTRARHILVSPNQLTTDEEALTKAKQLRQRLDAGEDFAALAKAHSDDRGSATQGGDLGWISPGQMVPEFEEMMNSLAKGEISAPFRSEFGWHVMQVTERRKYDGTAEVQRLKAREALVSRKREEAFQEWQRRLRSEAYVELRLPKS